MDQREEGASQPGVRNANVVLQHFYEDNIGLIYRYMYSKVGNREEAEDLTSQTFMKAVHGLDQERSPQSMQNWLFRIAQTTLADYWRIHYRVPTSSLEALLEAGWEGPMDEDEDEETQTPSASSLQATEYVRRILQALPDHYRDVLIYRFLLNLSIKETATKMDLTEANVKVLQFRALRRAAELEKILVEQ
jgi:RNA polymerase sigma-70 factor (ECF subfamily)